MKMLNMKEKEFTTVFINHLKINTRSIAVKTLLSDRNVRKINYKPYYQRNYVWDKTKASFFIESVLLGTEIPPLVLFKSGKNVEVIDGRQRYETLKYFKENSLKLSPSGLMKLRKLKNASFNKLNGEIKDVFLSSKIRIFEFEVVNRPQLDEVVEDKIKREIFRRYNTGITPLKAVEVDKAKYDKDELSNIFKEKLKQDKDFYSDIKKCFFHKARFVDADLITHIVNFFRRYMVLLRFPIKSYAGGGNRTEIIDLLYDSITSETDDFEEQYRHFRDKINTTLRIYQHFKEEEQLQNKLIYECILWAISVLDNEGVTFDPSDEELHILKEHLLDNIDSYSRVDSHHYWNILDRFGETASIFETITSVNFGVYFKNEEFKNEVKRMRASGETESITSDSFSNLRVHKPDPTSVPIDEIIEELSAKRYLLRPSYQRLEKINRSKASAIIESILLGVYLPPLFIYKSTKGTKEVVDGQQRLLSILGFMGKQYMDENGELVYSKHNNFPLKDLAILKQNEKNRFSDLDDYQQDKIYDFDLSIIEIDGKINPNFDPIDLFIRLNQKPYPIKNNSFEMWNSEIDREIAQRIKDITNDHVEWFYIRHRKPQQHQDRMLNEEMYTILAYLDYIEKTENNSLDSILFYPKQDRLNCRISDKQAISNFLVSLEDSAQEKQDFLLSIKSVNTFITNLKHIVDCDELNGDITSLFNVKQSLTYTRSLQDFYLIWYMIGHTTLETLLENKSQTIQDIQIVFSEFKNINEDEVNDDYMKNFLTTLKRCRANYCC